MWFAPRILSDFLAGPVSCCASLNSASPTLNKAWEESSGLLCRSISTSLNSIDAEGALGGHNDTKVLGLQLKAWTPSLKSLVWAAGLMVPQLPGLPSKFWDGTTSVASLPSHRDHLQNNIGMQRELRTWTLMSHFRVVGLLST